MTDQGSMRTVRVRLKLPGGLRLPHDALVRIRIEDISRADTASKPIAEKTYPADDAKSGDWLDVQVPAGLVDRHASYGASVQVSSDLSDAIALGDLISPAIHPVLTRGAPDQTEVDLIEVK
jgi:hypothetical protein